MPEKNDATARFSKTLKKHWKTMVAGPARKKWGRNTLPRTMENPLKTLRFPAFPSVCQGKMIQQIVAHSKNHVELILLLPPLFDHQTTENHSSYFLLPTETFLGKHSTLQASLQLV